LKITNCVPIPGPPGVGFLLRKSGRPAWRAGNRAGIFVGRAEAGAKRGERTMMPLTDLVTEMLSTGVEQEAVVFAVRTAEFAAYKALDSRRRVPPHEVLTHTPIGDMVYELLSHAIPNDIIISAVRAAELTVCRTLAVRGAGAGGAADPVAERRRAYDRERKRAQRMSAGTSTGRPPGKARSH
jgi:hypothetical protein